MNTRAFLATTAAAAFLFGAAATANAQNVSVSGSYSVTAVGGVTSGSITLGYGDQCIDTGGTQCSNGAGNAPPANRMNTLTTTGSGTPQTTVSGFSYTSTATNLKGSPVSPTTSSNNSGGLTYAGSNMQFAIDPATGNNQTATLNATFTITYGSNSPITFTAQASFAADSANDNDALVWANNDSTTGITNGTLVAENGVINSSDLITITGNGEYTGESTTPSGAACDCGYAEYAVSLGAGNGTLDIYLQDDEDWDLGSAIQLEYQPVGTPEPASMALFATGLVGFGAIRRRMTRKTQKAAA
jgi:hypothetical protein